MVESISVLDIEAYEDGNKVTYPTVIVSVAKDLENGSMSEMKYANTRYNMGLKSDIFTERYLIRPPRDAVR